MLRICPLLIALFVTGIFTPIFAQTESQPRKEQSSMSQSPYDGIINAPDFPTNLEWLNTSRPLSLKELRGKIVLLDFWTYCCINCMHIIPDLKRLEKKYEKELVVIGVHSAKFTGERDTDNIRQAILRYEIEHPVINDYAMDVWQQYTVNVWPTLILINPDGKIVGQYKGEGVFEPFDNAIAKLIEVFDARGKIDRAPLNLKLEKHKAPTSMLAFPGKVLADEKSQQLFVADSNHNRIIVASLSDYAVKEVIGSGEIGLQDGDFATAQFNHPQGMAFDGKTLFVADTENHAIRRIDFDKRTVATVAGTGKQARRIDLIGGIGRDVALNSPWDLVLHEGMLYVAMAGPHQLWKVNPQTGGAVPYAGSGHENIVDGGLNEAALAQPSGITTDGKKLYFADSEVSAIRAADLDPQGKVETIVGEGLFDYGDKDGKGSQVRLQHPLGVVWHDGALYVADTYNNKVKIVSPQNKSATTFLGTGKEGLQDGATPTFDEPGGVSIANGKLYIADTNNHAIRVADLKSKKVETIQFKNLEKLRPVMRKADKFLGETIELPEQTVEPGETTLTVQLDLPAGYKLNSLAPTSILVTSTPTTKEQSIRNPKMPLTISVNLTENTTSVNVGFVVYYCEAAKESLCYFKEARVVLPVRVKQGTNNRRLSVAYALKK
jgi:thiol-disulfide isomerase/thioredoxin